MKKNIGTSDRLLRLGLAIVIAIGILFTSSIVLRIILAIVSLFVLYEAVVGWCALYQLIGKNTCPISLQKNEK